MILRKMSGPRDIVAVVALRDEYYRQRGEPVQRREDAVFYVAEHRERIVACQSYATTGNECWVMDSYTDGSSLGARGLASLSQRAAELADQDGHYLLGMVHMDDQRMIRHSLARGWQISGVLIARAPRVLEETA